MKYADKLKDPRWQKKRLEILERDEWGCRSCCDVESMLAVHHLRYVKGKDPWEYSNSELITLCEDCHTQEHESRKESDNLLIEALQVQGFLASDVFNIGHGIGDIAMIYPPEVTSNIIEYALRDEATMRIMADNYFKHLAEKRTEKE